MENLVTLFIVLIMLLMIEFVINRREIFSVSFLSTAGFTVSTGYSLICFKYFANDISIKTVFVIIGALVAIFLGECLANASTEKIKFYRSVYAFSDTTNEITPICIDKKYTYCLFFLCLFLGAVRYYYLYLTSLKYGNPHNIFKAVAYTRSVLVAGEMEGHRLLSYGCTFCMAAVYTVIFVFFYNLFICKKQNLELVLPIIAYLLIPVASTGRVEYIQYLVVVFSIFVICYRKSKSWKASGNLKILIGAISAFSAFILMFRFIGSLRDKWDMPPNIFTNLIEYISSGIYGLDYFLSTGPNYDLIFGYETFTWLYSIINRFIGTNIPISSFFSFYTVGEIRSNIYTGLKPFVQDYSIAGMICIWFSLGFVFTLWLNSIRSEQDIKNCFIRVVAFSIYIYPVVMISVASTYNALLTTGYLLVFIFLILINKFLINPKNTKFKDTYYSKGEG